VDLTPQHQRLSYAQAWEALKDVVDDSRFTITFVNPRGPLGWLLRPTTVRGEVLAVGMAPLELMVRGRDCAVRIRRLASGKIPLRFDTRLLRNLESLRLVAKHEIAEVNFTLGFENQFKDPDTLTKLLEMADARGYESEK
jgi:hypothetical protein